MTYSSLPPVKPDLPHARSRAGDFVFMACVGLMTIVAAMMVGGMGAMVGGILTTMFMSALLLRFYTLRDAPTVAAGTNVQDDQIESLHLLRQVLNAMPQPIMVLNGTDCVEIYNPACVQMFGAEIAGRHISSIIRSPIALEVLRLARHVGEATEEEFNTSGVVERTRLFYASPLRAIAESESLYTLVMIRDRTEQKRLERMRTDFVASASHELRTPLTAMSGFIETLQGHAKDDPLARERFLEIMGGQAERMLCLVEDLIGLSAIELNEAKLPEDVVDLAGLVPGVCESLSPMVPRDGAQISWSTAEPNQSLFVRGDWHELFRLLSNLCENALKYGVADGAEQARVEIILGRGAVPLLEGAQRTGQSLAHMAVRAGVAEADVIWLQVRDHGEGIDAHDLPRLTERFYRVNPEISRSKGGTGLGLAIVKHILQRHNAGLQIESARGIGAVFTCIFPPVENIPNNDDNSNTPLSAQ